MFFVACLLNRGLGLEVQLAVAPRRKPVSVQLAEAPLRKVAEAPRRKPASVLSCVSNGSASVSPSAPSAKIGYATSTKLGSRQTTIEATIEATNRCAQAVPLIKELAGLLLERDPESEILVDELKIQLPSAIFADELYILSTYVSTYQFKDALTALNEIERMLQGFLQGK